MAAVAATQVSGGCSSFSGFYGGCGSLCYATPAGMRNRCAYHYLSTKATFAWFRSVPRFGAGLHAIKAVYYV